jgi:IclR family transcriptional regulator, pca regulon regulatory protein
VTDLGMSALNSTGLREHSHPYLEELRQRTSYTVNLSVLDGADILYVDRARSFRRGQSKIDLGLYPGSRLPAYCTSMGKILLAYMPKDELRDRLADPKLAKRGPNTITGKTALREELEEVADAGFAVNDEELTPELYAIAVPIRDEAHEVVAAINMAVHSSMISLGSLLTRSARILSQRPIVSPLGLGTGETMSCKAVRDVPSGIIDVAISLASIIEGISESF